MGSPSANAEVDAASAETATVKAMIKGVLDVSIEVFPWLEAQITFYGANRNI